jgi:hypothetical protein
VMSGESSRDRSPGTATGYHAYALRMASARTRPRATIEEATAEAMELWAIYRDARARDAPAPAFEALRSRVRGALARAKKRSSEPGFSTVEQQLRDLSGYIQQFRPREASTPASADDLLLEVDAIQRALDALGDGAPPAARRALAGRAAGVRARIEGARALSPDDDHDHDPYVDAEELLWDLEARLGVRRD